MDNRVQFVIVEDHENDALRSGEGGVVELGDGSLLMLYTCFHGGGSDHSPAFIAKRVSLDGGLTWGEAEEVFTPPANAQNCMSAALIRLQDGRLAASYCVKYGLHHLVPVISFSSDDGRTWTDPLEVTAEVEYFVVNNDRLTQLSDGTLVIPYALHERLTDTDDTRFKSGWNAKCGLFVSKDGGGSWQRPPHTVTHTPEIFTKPLFSDVDPADEELTYLLENHLGVFQEPGVVELPGCGLMLYARSLYAIYRCFAASVDSPWTGLGVIDGFNVPCGPSTIRLLPGSNRLVMLYNDRGEYPVGRKGYHNRTPLSVAVSDDNGRSWQRRGQLEDDSRNYCYFSLLFFADRFIASYYQSATRPGDAPEALRRRNLASLKVAVGPQSVFS